MKKRSSGDLLVSCKQTHKCTSLLTQLQCTPNSQHEASKPGRACPERQASQLVPTPSAYVLLLLQVGIVSYGPSVQTCGGEANLGVYTSVIVMRPWIDAQIKALKV